MACFLASLYQPILTTCTSRIDCTCMCQCVTVHSKAFAYLARYTVCLSMEHLRKRVFIKCQASLLHVWRVVCFMGLPDLHIMISIQLRKALSVKLHLQVSLRGLGRKPCTLQQFINSCHIHLTSPVFVIFSSSNKNLSIW